MNSNPQLWKILRQSIILTFVTHLLFIVVVLILSSNRSDKLYWKSDTSSYVNLAQNLLDHAVFSRDTTAPFIWEPSRTPGYPLMIAVALEVTGVEWSV